MKDYFKMGTAQDFFIVLIALKVSQTAANRFRVNSYDNLFMEYILPFFGLHLFEAKCTRSGNIVSHTNVDGMGRMQFLFIPDAT